MPRKTKYGKVMFSAGEVSTYVLCPEAWRLSQVERVTQLKSQHAKKAEGMHKEWQAAYLDSIFFTRSVRYVLYLIIMLLLVTLFVFTLR
jgi:hypothetical protein